MIALDTSSVIAYLSGEGGNDAEIVDLAFTHRQGALPPAVLSELLSDPELPKRTESVLRKLPLLTITSGYWERVGALRAKLLAKGLKARLADSLIAQSCIDHDTRLVTRDLDFKNFAKVGHLKLFSDR